MTIKGKDNQTVKRYSIPTVLLVQEACRIFEVPFDDRYDDYSVFSAPHGTDPEHVTLHMVADAMGISVVKARKLLITGGYYSTGLSRDIQELYKKALDDNIRSGKKREQAEKAAILIVSKGMRLGKASIYSYIPYKVTAYNLDEKSTAAIRQARYRERKKQSG